MLRNTTRKKLLVRDARTYSSDWAKGLGLMFRPSAPSFGVVFPFIPPSRASIHMWFVLFPLDILWLDSLGVVQEFRMMRPWSVHTPRMKCSYVLELPAGTIARTGTRAGDVVNIERVL